MKIRNLFFITCSWCCMSAMAQGILPVSSLNSSVTPKLHAVETPTLLKERHEVPVSATATDIYNRLKTENHFYAKTWFTWDEVKGSATERNKMRLDSIIGTNPDDSNYTRQYFVFDDQNRITRRINSYWNASTNAWETAEEYNFVWDKDGYVLMQSIEGYGQGERHEYVYNNRKLGIEDVISILNESGEWIKVQKSEYQYDEKDNIIDEMIHLWSGNEWVKATHNTATWDDQKRQTSILSMTWDGTEWIGSTKEDYVWHADDKLSYKGMWRWLDTKEWQLVDIFLQEFNEAGQCTMQHRNFWNDDRKDWSGEYPSWGPTGGTCITYEATITYDEQGRVVLQKHKECYNDSTEWFLGSEMITEWTDGLENSGYESEMNAYLYDYDTKKKTWNQREYVRYNAQGLKTWWLQQMQNADATEMNDLFEEKYEYDERGNLLYSAVWDWIEGIRTPTVEERNTYDTDNNIIESYFREADAGGSIPIGSPRKGPGHEAQDDEGWKNTSHFTYKYENGERIEKLGWRWNNSDWSPNFGEAVKYDWSFPASELITPIGWTDSYKIDFTYNYTGDGNDGWFTNTNTYYYAEHSTGINKTEAGNLSFANNILKVSGGNDIENCVYDITGKQIYQGNNSEENLNHLNKGIYVVRSLIDSKTYILKIIIR